MAEVVVERWDDTLAVRLPPTMVSTLALAEGDTLRIELRADLLVLRKSDRPSLALEDLFVGKTAAEWRALYAGSDPWGPDVGREIIDD